MTPEMAPTFSLTEDSQPPHFIPVTLRLTVWLIISSTCFIKKTYPARLPVNEHDINRLIA